MKSTSYILYVLFTGALVSPQSSTPALKCWSEQVWWWRPRPAWDPAPRLHYWETAGIRGNVTLWSSASDESWREAKSNKAEKVSKKAQHFTRTVARPTADQINILLDNNQNRNWLYTYPVMLGLTVDVANLWYIPLKVSVAVYKASSQVTGHTSSN